MSATKWEDVYRTQTARIAELEATIDAVRAANERAIKQWQAAHPGKELVIPDQAKMVEWLLEQLAKFDDPHRLHAHCVRHLTDLQVSHLFGERMTAVANDRDRLEAENAALKADKERLENYIAEQLHQLEVENTGQEVQIEQLEAENAALREDKERLDWLLNRGVAWRDCYDGYWSPGEWLYMRQDGRGTIDAARKEAQP